MSLSNKIALASLFVAIVGLLVTFGKSSESTVTNNYDESPNIENARNIEINYVKNITSTISKTKWITYKNQRFGFSVSYPSDWEVGPESDSSNGKVLFLGDPDVDVRAYAMFYEPGLSCSDKNDGVTPQLLEIKHERKEHIYIRKQSNTVSYCMSLTDSGNEYYITAKVTNEFFKENKKKIIEMAKSFALLNGVER